MAKLTSVISRPSPGSLGAFCWMVNDPCQLDEKSKLAPSGAHSGNQSFSGFDVTRDSPPRVSSRIQTSGLSVRGSKMDSATLRSSGDKRGDRKTLGVVGLDTTAPRTLRHCRLVVITTLGP